MILLNLHVAFCREHLIVNGFWWHPFDWQFSVPFRVVHSPSVHVTRQSKVGYFDYLAFTNEDISRRKVTVDESFPWQKLLHTIREGNFDHCGRRKRSCWWKVKQKIVKKAIKALILILQIVNILATLYIMPVIQLVPFPSLSAMRTSLGQRVREYHRHVSCQYQSWYSNKKYLHICYCRWCTKKRKIIF